MGGFALWFIAYTSLSAAGPESKFSLPLQWRVSMASSGHEPLCCRKLWTILGSGFIEANEKDVVRGGRKQ